MKPKTDPLFEHGRSLAGVTEDIKWGKDLIFSVGGKMFAGFQLPDGEPIGGSPRGRARRWGSDA